MLNQFAVELLRDLNCVRGNPLYFDTSLTPLFESISQNSEMQQSPCINPNDILAVINNFGTDIHFLSDHIMKQKTNDYSKLISGYRKYISKLPYCSRLSDSTKQKFKSMFNKQINNPIIYQQHLTHCYIHLYENSNFYLLLIVLQSKYVIVDSITQKNTGLHIQGWLNYHSQLSGMQFVDGDQYYELQDTDTKQKQITLDNQNVWLFDLFIDNSSTQILPLISHKFGNTPVLQFFCESQIGEVQLKEQKSLQSPSHPILKQLYLLSARDPLQPIKSNLQYKIEQIKGQKFTGFEQEHHPKVPQTTSKNLQLFRIEENQYEQSSAKPDDLDLYTKNLESKYLNAPKFPSLIDGLTSSDSQMLDKHHNPYAPLTHKEQSTISEIRNQTVTTQDSAINEHLSNLLDPKQLQNIYQDLCREVENPSNNLQQSQQIFQPYNVESLYFGSSQQHTSNRNFETQELYSQQQQQNQFYNQQPQLFLNQNKDYQQQQQQQYQQQQYLYQQQQQQYYYEQQQQQLFQQQQQQQLYQQQQLQYQMMQYHQQLQQYPNNLQIQQPEEQYYFEEPQLEISPKKWSFSPQKQDESVIIKKRTSNPEPQNKTSYRYSIRQSIKQQKKSEFQLSNTQKILQKEGAQIKDNEIPFKCKLKINSIHPYDFVDLRSNRAQKKMQEIEQGLLSQSTRYHKNHNFNALYRNEKFSDIVLLVNDYQYKSHKSVLIQVSNYFKELLETKQCELILQVDNLQLFDLVYKYIYLGKLTDSEWNEVGIHQSIKFYRLAEKLELYQLIEQLISRVVIPMMINEFVLDWYVIGFRNQNSHLSYIFKFVYVYTVTYFSLNCRTIINQIRGRQDDSIIQDQQMQNRYKKIFDLMTPEEIYFLVQQPLMQTDFEGVDNLLWLITEKKQCQQIDLLKQLSMDHLSNCGFKYKDFTNHQFEQNLPLLNNQIIVYPQRLQETKRRRSSIFTDQEFHYSESLFDEYSFYQQNANTCKINKLVYEMKINNVVGNSIVISECFASQSLAWRLIIDINDQNIISIYLQERGSIKNNLKYMNLEDNLMDESLPQYTKLNFISVLVKVAILNKQEQSNERVMYHTYPTNQFHTVGFEDIQTVNSQLWLKVYIQEDPLHSALMHWCGYNYNEKLCQLPYYTLYSLLKSDMLRVSEEKQILGLLYNLQKSDQEQNLDLLIHPIRYFYVPIGEIFTLSKDCQSVRQNKLFQSILNLLLSHYLDGKQNNQKPRKTYSRIDTLNNQMDFKKEWLKWLIYSDNKQLKINTNDIKKEVIEKQKRIEKQQQNQQQFQVYNYTPKKQFELQTQQSPKCNIF
ncbi:unnamed protein product (macronuclear) [Paramecium tetraurelia]|uniref:BTB domain-containing protein n=1 Tax=Paramecium tetraurelia TaxID=5888 RepID=A0CB86_PARTE|nr:uncharacterized protein GSPATT00036836001 [Paramecium tetraurelia]CAK68053.1 unnamed protein product [Paramecium tetraurelia]|eukprot:XP_001435450.1 hypothetical protein (macronuclear) [Paramecium tetraurelia strain d4-2]